MTIRIGFLHLLTCPTNSLQLNIGIIAACASFLKPLVGRLLKINSSVGQYPSSGQYNRSGHTPLDARGNRSHPYSASRRRTAGRGLEDEFELHTKNDFTVTVQDVVTTNIHAGRSRISSGNHSSSEAVNSYEHTSDNNSEEIILQQADRVIVRTTDLSVEYSERKMT